MASSEKLCLNWNDFAVNIINTLYDLKEDKDFTDLTLVCADKQVEVHKVVLASSSKFFQRVLKNIKHSHPLIYLSGIKFKDLEAVLSFMYLGQVNLAQEDLDSFLVVAQELEVKGLTPGEKLSNCDSNSQTQVKSCGKSQESANHCDHHNYAAPFLPSSPRMRSTTGLLAKSAKKKLLSLNNNTGGVPHIKEEQELFSDIQIGEAVHVQGNMRTVKNRLTSMLFKQKEQLKKNIAKKRGQVENELNADIAAEVVVKQSNLVIDFIVQLNSLKQKAKLKQSQQGKRPRDDGEQVNSCSKPQENANYCDHHNYAAPYLPSSPRMRCSTTLGVKSAEKKSLSLNNNSGGIAQIKEEQELFSNIQIGEAVHVEDESETNKPFYPLKASDGLLASDEDLEKIEHNRSDLRRSKLRGYYTKINSGTTLSKYKCNICDHLSIDSYHMLNHLEGKHFPGMFEYACDSCVKVFDTKQKFCHHRS